jgi:hypothetical protein
MQGCIYYTPGGDTLLDYNEILAMDPFILLSWTNMKLRDEAYGIDDLCETYNLDAERLVEKLKFIGYGYDEKNNQFTGI